MGVESWPQPSQEDLIKNREEYEKTAAKAAKSQKNLLQKITGGGMSQMDVMHADAKVEDGVRNDSKYRGHLDPDSFQNFEKEGADLVIKVNVKKEFATEELKSWMKESGSNPLMTAYTPLLFAKAAVGKGLFWDKFGSAKLEGTIDGKEVEIVFTADTGVSKMDNTNIASVGEKMFPEDWKWAQIQTAKVDGKDITNEEARKILQEHANNAIRRQNEFNPDKTKKKFSY